MTLDAGLDVHVLAATVGFCLFATFLSGLRPAWRLSRRALTQDLKESRGVSRPAEPKHRFLPRGLSTAGQIALSVVLVMVASLFTHSALKAVRTTPGYSLDDKLLLQVDMRAAGSEGAQRRQLCESLIEHLGALPGVRAAGASYSMPFDTGMIGCEIREYKGTPAAQAQDRGVEAVLYYVGGDFFQTLGLPLLRGRYFSPAESAAGDPNVVIIDEPLARQLRPDGNALGCLIAGLGRAKEVIGIVPGTRHSIFDKEARPHVYRLIWDALGKSARPLYAHLRVASTAQAGQTALLRQIPQEVRKVDAQLSVLSLSTLRDYHRNGPHVWFVRMVAALTLTFGGMALFLAALGIYAVKGYLVASRTPEIGIRMALGATNRGILAMVLRDSAALTLVGLSLGLLLAFGAARVASSVLCGVSPIDPLSIAATLALLGTASLLASYLPARRAARIDPIAALRCE
jgi:predicted permease